MKLSAAKRPKTGGKRLAKKCASRPGLIQLDKEAFETMTSGELDTFVLLPLGIKKLPLGTPSDVRIRSERAGLLAGVCTRREKRAIDVFGQAEDD